MKRILVTGATGGLGRNLVPALLEANYNVTASGRNLDIGESLTRQGAKFLPADLRDNTQVKKLCQEQDVVIHCAALSSPWGKKEAFWQHNVLATNNIISACLGNQVKRLVHISTPSIFCDAKNQMNITETTPLPKRFVNHYSASKYVAEKRVLEVNPDYLETISLSPRGIFGPHDTTLIPRLLKLAKRKSIPLFNHGSAIADITYVENVVQAIKSAITVSNTACGKNYLITNDEPLNQKKIMDMLFSALNVTPHYKTIPYPIGYIAACLQEWQHKLPWIKKEPTLTRYTLTQLAYSHTFNIEAAKQALHYTPKIDIETGIANTTEWMKENGYSCIE